jgi:glycosyltransferase involved in cell wall biosynthesis
VARQHQYDLLVAVSPRCQAVMRARLPREGPRVELLPTFVHRAGELKRTWRTEPLRLLYSGRLEQEHKRVLDLLPLADGLLRDGVRFTLTIAGTGSRLESLLGGLATLPHAGLVRLVGQIAPAQMPALYAGHDVLVQPSSTEGLSNALVEAMAAGLVPVVTRTRSGVSGVVTDGVNAMTVAVGDVEAMVAAVTRLSASPSALERMGRAAHAATADYGWPRYCGRLERLLDEVQSHPIAA